MANENNPLMAAWVAQEQGSFDGFDEYMATRISDAIYQSIVLLMNQQVQAKGEAKVIVPWGIFTAKVKQVGEGTNIAPGFEPTTSFDTYLNDDSVKFDDLYIENIDPELIKLIQEYVAWGYHGVDEKNPDPDKSRGARINPEIAEYFLGSHMRLLTGLAKDHEHSGKSYSVKVGDEKAFGEYSFDYKDDKIICRFTFDKEVKQALKNDSIQDTMAA